MLFRKLLLAVLLAIASLPAQETRGTLVGRVTDSSGAVVVAARVEIVNLEMGTRVEITSNEGGFYNAPLLISGNYKVTVTAAGFKQFVRSGIPLQIADRLEVNATLEIGDAQQSVTVTGAPELLSTESASLSATVSSKQIQDLPLAYGNPFALIGATSGAAFTGSPKLNRPFEPTHIVGFAINGTRGNRSDVTLDGAPATATANANEVIASYVPITDMLTEFRVQTATFDAAVGNTEGGVTNLSIRSGTNDFHGTAYFSLTRKDLWANDFYNNSLGRERGDYRFNRPGFTVGGPVWIPKLYNGRNKTFFQFGFEDIHDSRPRYDATTPQVPTPAMKNGDFSQLLALGSNYQIYNPYTRRLVNGQFQESPFPGNRIPTNLFNPVGKAILDKYYANPTSPGGPDGQNNLLIPTLPERSKYYNYTLRIDQNLSDRQRLYARYSAYNRDSTYNDYFGNAATGTSFSFISKNAVIDDTIVISPTLVLDVRYGYNRFIRINDGPPSSRGFDLTQIDLPASYNSLVPADIRRFPRIDLSGYIGTAFTGENRPVDTHSLTAAVTKSLGAHSIRGGIDFRSYRENDSFFSNEQTGRFNFDATYTRGPLSSSATAPNNLGQSVAALLLGLPSNTNSYLNQAASYAEQSMTWGFYLQDDWKINPKLTLNLGLRWEFESPLTERYNRSVAGFDPNYVPPFAAAAMAAYVANKTNALPASQFAVRGGLTFAGVGGNPSGLYQTPKNNLLPRIGLAYSPNNRTAVRAGFGIYQGFLGERRGDVTQTGFSQQTPFNPFAADGVTILNTLSDPFPNGLLPIQGNALGGQTGLGQALTFFNQHPKASRAYRWQFNIQRQFAGAVFEASYVGNKGVNIEVLRNINVLPNQYLSTANTRDNIQNAYLTSALANPFYNLLPAASGAPSSFTGATIARQQLLRPYPQFGDITTSTNEGYSWYHSLQLHAEKRFTKNFSVTGSYTFSKFMQATELLNMGDPRPTRMISDQDVPHRFAATFLYQLPFGRNGQFLKTLNPVADRLIGGWEVTGFYSIQSGFPLNFMANDYFLTSGDIALSDPTLTRYFNTGAFVTASAAQPVSHLRVNPYRFSSVRGPSTNNIDLSLLKDTAIREGIRLRFSVQALNAFNRPLLPVPNLVPANALFGVTTGSTQSNYPRSLQLELKLFF
ncbi:MAG TPA: TonB-dependent receptor [Bryobacteraceae bacterium]|nr:TonB-dependent receptor [Bryobacteraceae bacterium]